MSLNETLEELDFDDDKKETCMDTEVVELSGSPLADDLLAKSDSKQLRDSDEEVLGSVNAELRAVKCVDETEEGETLDDAYRSDDIEEGEIGGLPDSEFLYKYSCRYYQKGLCCWGKNCRFFHLSDKGLYNMFDVPVVHQSIACHMNQMEKPTYFCHALPLEQPPIPEALTAWDRSLVELKSIMEKSKAKKKEDCFEENKLYLTTEDKQFAKPSGKDRPMLQAVCKRMLSHFVPKQSEGSKTEASVAKKPIRTESMKKSNFHSEWTDPWRRSKTPPRRKRSPSKSSSTSSKSMKSSRESASTSKSPSKCRSPEPKRVHGSSHKFLSRSFRLRSARKKSYRRTVCKSSSSSSKRSSSRSSKRSSSRSSKRSTPSPASFTRRGRRRSIKRRTPSRSPSPKLSKRRKSWYRNKTFRKRSRSISPTLPFHGGKNNAWERAVSIRRKSRSVSRSASPQQSSSQAPRPTEKSANHSPAKQPFSRSSSINSVAEAKGQKSDNLSCSDMSISPLSGSSTESRRCVIESAPCYSEEPISGPVSRTADHRFSGAGASKHGIFRDNTDIPYDPPVVKSKTQNKRLDALELELCRYRSDAAISPSRFLESPRSKGRRTGKSAKSTRTAKKKTPKKINLPAVSSKRELLLRQLQCIEEAIARKKLLMH